MIPHVLHLYWGRNKPLSFMRYMTVVSFSKLNPDWEIQVHYPVIDIREETQWSSCEHKTEYKHSGYDYFDALSKIQQVQMVDENFDWVSIPKGFSEIHKSDILRWKLLSTVGGVWSDFDILYINPLSSVDDLEYILCSHTNKKNEFVSRIGFLGSMKDGSLFAKAFDLSLQVIQKPKSYEIYQSLGRFVVDSVVSTFDFKNTAVWNMPLNSVYPMASHRVLILLYKPIARVPNADTFGIHWFGGFDFSTRQEERVKDERALKAESNKYLFSHMLKIWRK